MVRKPLQHREAVLVVHEVAAEVSEWDLPIELGLGKAFRGEQSGAGCGKSSYPVRSALGIGPCFPVWTVADWWRGFLLSRMGGTGILLLKTGRGGRG